ncbi:MAG: sugar transferase [Propionibacteriaceae bacterium]|jgi:exopolysaccharide biosynthesis polyprenyl glycosylphosphotransferase|nr:sugar transferase [Propionibacteriaceae bacterium]
MGLKPRGWIHAVFPFADPQSSGGSDDETSVRVPLGAAWGGSLELSSSSPVAKVIGWQRAYARVLMVSDAVIVTVFVFFAQFVRFGFENHTLRIEPYGDVVFQVSYYWASAAIIVAWLITLSVARTRHPEALGIGSAEYERVAKSTFMFFGILALVSLVFRIEPARLYVFIALPAGMLALLIARWLWRKDLTHRRAAGQDLHRVVLVGFDGTFKDICKEIMDHPSMGLTVVGVVTLTPGAQPQETREGVMQVPVSGTLMSSVDQFKADTVIYTGGGPNNPESLRQFGWELQSRAMTLILVPSVIDLVGARIHMRRMSGLPLVYAEYPQFGWGTRVAKRVVDLAASLLALLVLIPFFLIIALAIKVDSPGPVFFMQPRVGLYGKPFRMFKFRSMVEGADAQWQKLANESATKKMFKMKDDPRITRVGRFLRRSSIDELPQLMNIVVNHMSFVGPRPPLLREVSEYSERERRKLLVKPGLTGLWQINGRADLGWEDSIRLDLYYVENWSVMLDAMIVLRTVRAVFRRRGAY